MVESPETWSAALLGKVLAGRYRVTDVLGAGGVGAVFGAVHLAVGRRVALKVLHPEMLSHGSVVERFHREARAAAACAREGVVAVIDLDQDPACGPFLVMEHLEGETLSARLRARAPLSTSETLQIVHAILHTLAAVHDRGIIHRDLKPANVMLARSPEGREVVKILDFGLAREVASTSKSALTLPGSILGTPRFMAPEQAAGDPTVDSRADLYAVGAILYCCLGGLPPYADVAPEEALHAVLLRSPIALDRLRPDLPAELVAIVTRAMARNREERFPDAASLSAALQTAMPGFDASNTISGEVVPLPPAAPAAPAPVVTAPPAHTPEPGSVAIAPSVNRAPAIGPSVNRAPAIAPPVNRAPPAQSRTTGRTVVAAIVIVVALVLIAGGVGAIAVVVSRSRPSATLPAASPTPPPAPPPSTARAPVAPTIAVPTIRPPSPPPPGTPTFTPIVGEPGLEQHPQTGEIRCTSGVHELSRITLDLPLRIVLFVQNDCHLTCISCTLVGTEPVILVSGRGRLTLEESTVTARNGAALFVGDTAQATLADSRVTGRLPADINGTLTTRRTVYSSGVQRNRGASVIDQGGNTGL